jgi:hypothetical protein
MSDPQDLLYTNRFVSENILSDKELTNETKYYDRYKNYIDDKKDSEIEKYVDNDTLESSPINLNKTLNRKWPITDSRNHYPLFDTYINDISNNRYRKNIITKINIDSLNRDISQYLYPNNFSLPFPKVFGCIKSIVVNDICIKNPINSVSSDKNTLAWQFASRNYITTNNIDLDILPAPDYTRRISYSQCSYVNGQPLAVVAYKSIVDGFGEDNNLEYEVNLSLGDYTTTTLIQEIKYRTSKVLHNGKGNGIGDLNPNGVIETPYSTYPNTINNPNLFSIDINPISGIVKFVNRIEELKIYAIQTFSQYETNFAANDVFYNYSNATNKNLNQDYIYITLGSFSDSSIRYITNNQNPNPFPLVITDLINNIGNIDCNIINFTEFYDRNLYGIYNLSELTTVSTYLFNDSIILSPTITLLRFAFILSTGNVNGKNYIRGQGDVIYPVTNECIIYSNVINQFLIKNSNLSEYTYLNNTVYVGRAILFRFVFDFLNCEYQNYETDTLNVKKKSVLHILGWPISNQTNNLYSIGTTLGFRFVHTNIQYYLATQSQVNRESINYNFDNSTNPQINLNLISFGGEYFFVSNSYIFMKIQFNTNDTITSQEPIVNAISAIKLQYNQVYNSDSIFQIPLGFDYNYLNSKQSIEVIQIDQSNIFAKILVSNIAGNIDTVTSNIINNNSFSINYFHCLDNISSVSVSLYDTNLKLLDIRNDFSFTLNFTEMREVLKETSVNSKTNQVHTEGYVVA